VQLHLITNVWGEKHVDIYLQATLPSLLASGNLPKLANEFRLLYRFHTTPWDAEKIRADRGFQVLKNLIEFEFVTPLKKQTPSSEYHVHWFHKAAAEAQLAKAHVMFLPPDTLWPRQALGRCGELLRAGFKAVANPFLQVCLESCLKDARKNFFHPERGALEISPENLTRLALRHLHPLSFAVMPESPHTRPALDMHWQVGCEGFVSRFAVREMFAFNPCRCQMTYLWYPEGEEDFEKIYFAEGPHDIAMLSLDPLYKYNTNYILNHQITPGDLARSSLHPWNTTNQTRVFSSKTVAWYSGKIKNKNKWKKTFQKASYAAKIFQKKRKIYLKCKKLKRKNKIKDAAILALASEIILFKKNKVTKFLNILIKNNL